jgi:hypothetical protein
MKVRYNVTVPAVSEEALPGILKKLGLYDDVASGKAACYVCGAPLTLDTIGAIAKLDGKAVLICSKPSCIGKASLLASRAKARAMETLLPTPPQQRVFHLYPYRAPPPTTRNPAQPP